MAIAILGNERVKWESEVLALKWLMHPLVENHCDINSKVYYYVKFWVFTHNIEIL